MISPEPDDWQEHDYYAIIGLPPTASQREIVHAFRTLARATHPDANQDDPQAAARFALLAQAKAVLGDPATRAAYDRARRIRRRPVHQEAMSADDRPEPTWLSRVRGPTHRPAGATVRPGPVTWIPE